jgi:hypothetical protein
MFCFLCFHHSFHSSTRALFLHAWNVSWWETRPLGSRRNVFCRAWTATPPDRPWLTQ